MYETARVMWKSRFPVDVNPVSRDLAQAELIFSQNRQANQNATRYAAELR